MLFINRPCMQSYNMGNLCELNRYQIYREVKLHSSLQHENIIMLYAAFQEGGQVVLVQEYAEAGDLFLLLHRWVRRIRAGDQDGMMPAQGTHRSCSSISIILTLCHVTNTRLLFPAPAGTAASCPSTPL
jgi:serine/threonine protein kinase